MTLKYGARVFVLIIGQKQSFFVIASTKNGIDMKCLDSQPLREIRTYKFQNIFLMAFNQTVLQDI